MPVISTCAVCKQRFTYVDRPVKCDGCSLRVHRKCSKLSAEELKCLSLKNIVLKFFCEPCTHGTIQLAEIGRLDDVHRSVNISIANNMITKRSDWVRWANTRRIYTAKIRSVGTLIWVSNTRPDPFGELKRLRPCLEMCTVYETRLVVTH